MTATSDGGVVAVGYTTSTSTGKDLLLVKFDTCADVVWKKTLGGPQDEEGRAVIEIPGGDLVVVGTAQSFGGPGDHLLISKLTSTGVEVRTKVLTDPSGGVELRGYDLIRDSDGNFVVTGTVWDNLLVYSILVAKFDSDLDLIVKSGFRGASGDYWGEGIAEACDGDYIVVGGKLAAGDDHRVLIARIYPGLLAAEWGRVIADPDVDAVGHGITSTSDGWFVMTGDTGGHLFVSKLNCSGDPVPSWQWTFPATSVGHDVIETAAAELVVVGELGSRFLQACWQSNGSANWAWGWGLDGCDSSGYGLTADLDDRIWVAGTSDCWGAGQDDGVVAKLRENGQTCLPHHQIPTSPAEWNPGREPQELSRYPLLDVVDNEWPIDTQSASSVQDYVVCDDITEGCCLPDGRCLNLTPAVCEDPPYQGVPQGCGTDCALTTLAVCCMADGSCETPHPMCCDDLGGTPIPNEECSAPEACCLAWGACEMADPVCCTEVLGGAPQGPGTQCSTTAVACCLSWGMECDEADPICCDDLGGSPGIGDHCLGDNDGNGIDDACPNPVPTISGWGVGILSVLLAAAGVYVGTRRRRAVSS